MITSTSRSAVSHISPVSPAYDPWDPIHSLRKYGRHVLTSVEFTVTHLCNMRCEHCAVGDTLTMTEGELIPLSKVLSRLDKVEHLETISITGGEPSYRLSTIRNYIIPILKYARERGVKTQLNSNLTLDYARYEEIAPHLDVMHISFNYENADDFHAVCFAKSPHPVGAKTAMKLYEQMMDNAARLARGGLFVSAESMINYRTHRKLAAIHRLIGEMGCRRHEVHPMYTSDFASGLPVLPLGELRTAIGSLLDARDPNIWMLFGTLPFFHCNPDEEDQRLLRRLKREPNVTVRNDPDGRNRLNVNLFTGDLTVTDFADVPPLGNLHRDEFDDVFERWRSHPLYAKTNCYCPSVGCCGPNLLVMDTWYPDTDFTVRQAWPSSGRGGEPCRSNR